MYGQQCRSCDDEDFQNPRWYKEEVTRVLKNVHQKIGEVRITPATHFLQAGVISLDILRSGLSRDSRV